MKMGDVVTVYPHGKPEHKAQAKVLIISENQRSIAVGFRDKPPFPLATSMGMMIYPELGIVLLALRDGADCKSMEETTAYLEEHPEARELLEAYEPE